MSPPASDEGAPFGGFPRVSGDEPSLGDATELSLAFSPRERG